MSPIFEKTIVSIALLVLVVAGGLQGFGRHVIPPAQAQVDSAFDPHDTAASLSFDPVR